MTDIWKDKIPSALLEPPVAVGFITISGKTLPYIRIKLPDGHEIAAILSEEQAAGIAEGLRQAIPRGGEEMVSSVRPN